ncbi:14995_t:CDS:2 [Entrophospora sp. SA101]|nr:14995_t:CDS:2 [Entrophospora sp. SA101]CAJ0828762.1 9161_t:CDS:2 [Entrophospora sp. SA101]
MNTTRPKVLLTRILPPDSQKLIENARDIELYCWKDEGAIPRNQLLKMAKGVDGILCMLTEKIDKELLDAAGHNLKVISTMSVGYDHVDISELCKKKIPLGYTPGVLTDATADITVLLVLAAGRRLQNDQWNDWSPTWMLVGLGRIGTATAHRLKPFIGTDGKIIYSGRTNKPEATNLGAARVEFDKLLSESDVICVCCSLNEETKGMFNYDAFKKMKRNIIFVNSARGAIVNQEDLCRALSDGLLGSVGLDVTTPEPLPSDHPLLKFNNVTVVPHIGSSTLETRTLMGNMAVENVLAGVRGEVLPNAVRM